MVAKMCIAERVSGFMSLSRMEKAMFLEALSYQLWVGLILKIIPFRQIPRLFANPVTLTPHHQPGTLSGIRGATQRASRISPWRNRCLVQSLAARCMLKRRRINSELSLGVLLDQNGKMVAHAWIRVGGFEVVSKSGNYTELYHF